MLSDLLVARTTEALDEQSSWGAMPAGRNGAYGDAETPVRNTAHWLISFSLAYRLTGEQRFRRAAEACLNFLLPAIELFQGGVIVRHTAHKDKMNGVLGQAHVIEALHYAFALFDREDARSAALGLIDRHVYDPAWRCWRRTTPDGLSIAPDDTFNHQLYFAATLAIWAEHHGPAQAGVVAFAADMKDSFRTRADGRIVHSIPNDTSALRRARRFLRSARPSNPALLAKEANYHLYNFYAFALLAASGVKLSITGSESWQRALRFANGPEIEKRLTNEFWSRGLVSGTETIACDRGYFRQLFSVAEESDLTLACNHLEFTSAPFGRCELLSPDPVTQRARIYRYWRLLPVDAESRVGSTPLE